MQGRIITHEAVCENPQTDHHRGNRCALHWKRSTGRYAGILMKQNVYTAHVLVAAVVGHGADDVGGTCLWPVDGTRLVGHWRKTNLLVIPSSVQKQACARIEWQPISISQTDDQQSIVYKILPSSNTRRPANCQCTSRKQPVNHHQ